MVCLHTHTHTHTHTYIYIYIYIYIRPTDDTLRRTNSLKQSKFGRNDNKEVAPHLPEL